VWHNVILIERISERKAVLAVKQCNPFGLLADILTHIIQSDCFAWRPLKANSDNMSFFFVSAFDAAMSSIRYSVGVSAAIPYRARSQLCSLSSGSMKRKRDAWGPRHSHGRSR